MALMDEIKQRILDATKAGSEKNVEKSVLRVALGDMQLLESRKGSITDEECLKIIRKMVQSNNECTKTDILLQENEILEAMLPKLLTSEEITSILFDITGDIMSCKSDGQAVGVAMKSLKSQGKAVDGKVVAEVVKNMRK